MTLVAAIAIVVAILAVGYAVAARRRERRFAAMFENSSEMMCVYDANGAILRANSAALKRMGFGKGDIGKHFEVHVAPEELSMVEHAFAQTLAGQANEFATVFVDALGRKVPVIANLAPIFVGGRTVGVVGAARDVTAEQLYEEQLLHNRERFRAIFEQSAHAMAAVKPDGTISAVNVAMERLTGYRNEEIVGKTALVFAPPDRREIAQERLADMVVKPRVLSYESTLLSRSGQQIPIAVDVLPIRVQDRSEGFYMTVKDLTHERALASRLTEKDHRLRALYRVASSASGPATQIDEALSLGAQSLSMPYGFVAELSGVEFVVRHRCGSDDGVIPPVDVSERLAESPRALAFDDFEGGKSCIGSRISIRGETYGTLIFLDDKPRNPPFDQSDADFIDLLVSLVSGAVAREIDDRELEERSLRDPLTGLPNRAKLEGEIARSIARARRLHTGFAIHFVDLDRFKPINDELGHEAGDAVLQQISNRLSSIVRAGDLVARVGGDEFVLIQTGVKDAGATGEFAERIVAAVIAPVLLDNERAVSVGCSVGAAVFPQDGMAPRALIRAADAAMYRAKQRGRSAAP